MNAVIIYDRFDFAAKAKAMLERAAHGTGEATHWSVKPWRVDMLKLPPAAEAALAEAAEAHLIVLAVRQVQSLFPGWWTGWSGGPRAGRFRRPPWRYGMVETPIHARRERHPSCRSLPGAMA